MPEKTSSAKSKAVLESYSRVEITHYKLYFENADLSFVTPDYDAHYISVKDTCSRVFYVLLYILNKFYNNYSCLRDEMYYFQR